MSRKFADTGVVKILTCESLFIPLCFQVLQSVSYYTKKHEEDTKGHKE